MARGGYRPGAGRPKGSRTKVDADASAQTGIASPDEESPLEYMLHVMRDPAADPVRRDRMAIAAAPFVHRKKGEASQREQERARAAVVEDGSAWEQLLRMDLTP